ncbi:MAG: PorT family protein, partial [Bacteroidota bacterium]|nr:PorT family protein [Bacteroidota bacterium]
LKQHRSIHVNLQVIDQGINLVKHHFYLTTGLGFDFYNFHFENDITLLPTESLIIAQPSSVEFKKNKLASSYVSVPLLFHLETNPFDKDKSFHLAFGGYGNMLLKSWTKQVAERTTEFKGETKQRISGDYNMNVFNYGLSGQIGFGGINFYANCSLTPLFENGVDPAFRPITFGVTFGRFSWD